MKARVTFEPDGEVAVIVIAETEADKKMLWLVDDLTVKSTRIIMKDWISAGRPHYCIEGLSVVFRKED